MLRSIDMWLQNASEVAFVTAVAMCILATVFWRVRKWTADLLQFAGGLWLITLWLSCTLGLYHAWGWIGFAIGFLLLGFGTIPLALLCFLIGHQWLDAFNVVAALRLILVSGFLRVRMLGSYIARRFLIDTAQS